MNELIAISTDPPVFQAATPEATRRLAYELSTIVLHGTVIGLSGPLGAGKTEFVRGFVEAIGGEGQVSSPTFVLEAVYQGGRNGSPIEICHWDLYRLADTDRTIELTSGVDLDRVITVVEWPERVAAVEDLLSVKISIGFLEPQIDPETGRLSPARYSPLGALAPDGGSPHDQAVLPLECDPAAEARIIKFERINDGETARKIRALAESLSGLPAKS